MLVHIHIFLSHISYTGAHASSSPFSAEFDLCSELKPSLFLFLDYTPPGALIHSLCPFLSALFSAHAISWHLLHNHLPGCVFLSVFLQTIIFRYSPFISLWSPFYLNFASSLSVNLWDLTVWQLLPYKQSLSILLISSLSLCLSSISLTLWSVPVFRVCVWL